MDYGTIQTRVAEYLDRDDLTTKIRGWINDTRKDIALKYDFDYLYAESTATTTAGCANYALPADYLGHMTVWQNYKKLAKIRPREADELTQTDSSATNTYLYLFTEGGLTDDNNRGSPDYYIERGMELQLYPTPDDTYTITLRYYAQPSSWTESTTGDNGQYDYITTFHFEAVIWGAALRGAIFLDDEQKKANYMAAYGEAIKEMVQREQKKNTKDLKVRMKTWKDYDLSTFERLHKISTD